MNSDKNLDAIIVFGSGIKEDGAIPDSSVACLKKAVELSSQNSSLKLITCGKWSYSLTYIPPHTEAEALRLKAIEMGFPAKNIFTEGKSITTISNACLAKEEYLEKNNWKHIALISIYPQSARAMYNLERVLGPSYTSTLILADFRYPLEKEQALEVAEKQKIIDAKNFLEPLPFGNHKAIFDAAMADLEANYKCKT